MSLFKTLKNHIKNLGNALADNEFSKGFKEGGGFASWLDGFTGGDYSKKKQQKKAVEDSVKKLEIEAEAQSIYENKYGRNI